ncbi:MULTISPECIES: hypothetical protein [Stenotrophomonas]|nr:MULTISPECIES: hypothetical protein [Stenotrophomonas]
MNNAQKRAAERAANKLLKSKGFASNGASLKSKRRKGKAKK